MERRTWIARLSPDARVVHPPRLMDPRPDQRTSQALGAFARPGRPVPPHLYDAVAREVVDNVVDPSVDASVATSPPSVNTGASVVGQTFTDVAPSSVPVGVSSLGRRLVGRIAPPRAAYSPSPQPGLASQPGTAPHVRAMVTEIVDSIVAPLRAEILQLRAQVVALGGASEAVEVVEDAQAIEGVEVISAVEARGPFALDEDGQPVEPECLPALPDLLPA